jgi:hypothetical protein
VYRSGADYPKEQLQSSSSNLQYIGSWAGFDQQGIEVASGGSKIHHTAYNGPPLSDEAQASPPGQTQIDDHVPSERYLKQSIRDEPWNLLHVQQK